MRDIKFRAWYQEAPIPTDFDRMFWSESDYGSLEEFFKEWEIASKNNETHKAVLMQYTDLKDKNGVEIYEGDVVIERPGAHPSVVEFLNGSFQAVHSHYDLSGNKTGEYKQVIGFLTTPVTVIGNIYENPDLIK
jgi:uncharacterized phage protein (TIGR01671 family)